LALTQIKTSSYGYYDELLLVLMDVVQTREGVQWSLTAASQSNVELQFSLTVSQTCKIKLKSFGWHLWHQYQITWWLLWNVVQSYTE
jgi:hypothetical protein